MMKPAGSITIDYDLPDGRAVIVEAHFSAYYPAQTYGPPERCSPAEGAECERLRIVDAEDGQPVTLSEKDEEELVEYVTERWLEE